MPLVGAARARVQLGLWRRWQDVFTQLVANSEGLAERLRAAGLPVTTVIRNATHVRPARPPLASPPTIAYAGRFVHKKGIDVLLRSVALLRQRVPDCRLVLAGDGPDRATVHQLVDRLGLGDCTEVTGHLAEDELERRLAGAWVLAVPSRYDEPFANTAIEAMMRGTAVVASAVGGCPEIVRHGQTGLLVPADDPSALAAALEQIVSSAALAESMGAAGRATALAEFGIDRMLDQFEALYETMVGRPLAVAQS
jgi:glycosyltransferase involved in cell wall biosynthesis